MASYDNVSLQHFAKWVWLFAMTSDLRSLLKSMLRVVSVSLRRLASCLTSGPSNVFRTGCLGFTFLQDFSLHLGGLDSHSCDSFSLDVGGLDSYFCDSIALDPGGLDSHFCDSIALDPGGLDSHFCDSIALDLGGLDSHFCDIISLHLGGLDLYFCHGFSLDLFSVVAFWSPRLRFVALPWCVQHDDGSCSLAATAAGARSGQPALRGNSFTCSRHRCQIRGMGSQHHRQSLVGHLALML